MAKTKILYSTNTFLSYYLAERYYDNIHFAWASPYFSPKSADKYATVPPTSSPYDIYHNLLKEVLAGDRHSKKIEANRAGLKSGADVRRAAGKIDAPTRAIIEEQIDQAGIQVFRPVVYVMPLADVDHLKAVVPVAQRAHPLAEEYIISALPRDLFDLIELIEGQ